jgi:hypothetical protein
MTGSLAHKSINTTPPFEGINSHPIYGINGTVQHKKGKGASLDKKT